MFNTRKNTVYYSMNGKNTSKGIGIQSDSVVQWANSHLYTQFLESVMLEKKKNYVGPEVSVSCVPRIFKRHI